MARLPIRRRRTWASTVVLAVIVLLAGVSSPGDAQPGLRRATPAAGAPGIPPVPADFGQDDFLTFNPVTPSVTKAKVQFSLPDLTLRTTLFECVVGVGFISPDPCPYYDVTKLPFPAGDDSFFWVAVRALSWVVSSPGPKPTYGRFPPVRVHALVFGTIPVSATVQLTQTVHHNLWDPLRLDLVTPGSVTPGNVAYPGYPRAPDYGPTYQTGFQLPYTVQGTVDVKISHVTVDEVPVDVGRACRTATPAKILFRGPGGYYPEDNLPQRHRDRPGGFLPINSELNPDGSLAAAGWLDGSVNIPAFRGCHDGAEDLDPLITGLISGPGNPISAYANHAVDLWCNSPLAHCPPAAAVEQRAALSVARLVANGRHGAQVEKAVARLRAARAAVPPVVKGPSARR